MKNDHKSWSYGFGRYLDDTVAGCEQKSSDFEERQKLRAEELEAIKKAIEIISSGAVPGLVERFDIEFFSDFSAK